MSSTYYFLRKEYLENSASGNVVLQNVLKQPFTTKQSDDGRISIRVSTFLSLQENKENPKGKNNNNNKPVL